MMNLPTQILNRITASTRQVYIDKHIMVGKAKNWAFCSLLFIEKGGVVFMETWVEQLTLHWITNSLHSLANLCSATSARVFAFYFFAYSLITNVMKYMSSMNYVEGEVSFLKIE